MATPGVTPRNERTRAPSAVRDSTTLARTDDGVMSRTMPCITPTSGGAPGALDEKATSTSPVIVVCMALSPCPQKRSSSGSLTTTSIRSAEATTPSASMVAPRKGCRPGRSSVPRKVTRAVRPCGKPAPRSSTRSPTSISAGRDLAHLDEWRNAVPLARSEAEGRKRQENEEESRAQQETFVIEEVP